ncbi:MAG: glycosyltransferase [Candidatus Saganbacteria bacterium]|nr:glycosyltransferase [Candidatus Saganbacteria bacterium]
MKNKTLSVIMTNYNYGHYIGEALEAIFSQSFPPTELILVDDSSTDNSLEIINAFSQKHPNLKLIKNQKNMGALYSVNLALDQASSDYVYAAASDDKILPGFFEKSMDLLQQYPQAGLCCSDLILQRDSGNIENKLHLKDSPAYFPPKEVLQIFLKDALSPIISNTVIMKRAALLEAGKFRPELWWATDLFVNSVVAFRYGFCYIPQMLTVQRMHSKQLGGQSNKKKNLSLEHKVIANLIECAKKPEYHDVLPCFRKTAGFSEFPWEVLKVVVSNIKYWDFLSFKLISFGWSRRYQMNGVL